MRKDKHKKFKGSLFLFRYTYIYLLKKSFMLISKITWNFPIGIDLGFYTIHFYSLMFVVAFSLGYYLMGKIYTAENRSKEDLESVFMYAVIATIVGARLGQVFFYQWDYFQHNLLEIFLPVKFKPNFKFTGFQGLASHGAAIGFIVAMYFYSKKVVKKPTLWSLDRVTIPAAFGGIFVRIGNFFNSEIIGNDTSFGTGVKFIKSKIYESEAIQKTGIRNAHKAYKELENNPKYSELINNIPYSHPAQLYEAFGYIFVSFFLLYLYWKTDKKNQLGFLFGIYMLLIFFVRFLVENVKVSQGGKLEALFGEILSTGQWLSIPFMLVGIYFIVTAKNRKVY